MMLCLKLKKLLQKWSSNNSFLQKESLLVDIFATMRGSFFRKMKEVMGLILGILAGMGPRSTAVFVNNVVEACTYMYGAKNDIDFPPMSIFSLPTPFYPNQELNHKEMLDCLKDGIQ